MKKIIFILLVSITTVAVGQRRYAADRYFKEYAYQKSAELYQRLNDKGDQSYLVLSRLGDSHYFTTNFTEAEKAYEKLMAAYENIADAKHVFRYAQVLKSNGKVSDSDTWLLKLKKLTGDDSRVSELEKNKNYFAEYTNKPKTYINIHNLSTNTKFSDFGGFLHDGYFYFASTRPDQENKKLYKWNNQPYLDIYKAKQKPLTAKKILDVELAEKVASLTTKYHESNVIITKDGQTVYFTRDNFDGSQLKGDKERTTHLKLYRAERNYDSWGEAEELPFNDDAYSIGHPALSADEKTLYFVSDMPEGYGGTDLYKVTVNDDGTFGNPENLGSSINTEGREMFPFVGSDNRLYFSSDGHLGLGALDVFESTYDGTAFSKPVNLGAPINGPMDDFSFVINDEKSAGYFSSNRSEGRGDDDIYSFLVYKCKEDIDGFITDTRTGAPIPDALVKLMNEKGEPLGETRTASDGGYSFKQLECEKRFIVVASKADYKSNKTEQATQDINKKVVKADLTLESLIVEDQIVINPIYFDFDLYDIREDAEYELEHIVSVMKNHPEMVIKIESHTDSRGKKAYNLYLSDKRAKATRDYIISRGIAPERIESAKGYGESQLLNNCDDANSNKCTEEEHQKNRRSYFYIVNHGSQIKSSAE